MVSEQKNPVNELKISSVEFVKSSVSVETCPKQEFPEYAFIGRSNVGKSSLINMLTGKKDLAKTSSKPGKTLLINHFIINEQWHLVDLPGYGYAKASKTMRDKLKGIIEGYVLFRQQLTNLFVLVECVSFIMFGLCFRLIKVSWLYCFW